MHSDPHWLQGNNPPGCSRYNALVISTAQLWSGDGLPQFLQDLLAAEMPWELLERLDAFVATVTDDRQGRIHPNAVIEGNVYLHNTACIGPGALVEGPAWIGPGAMVGHGAYVRGGVVMAEGSKVGHSSEVKRSLLLAEAKAPHFNYVGDSVLGRHVNLGAGVKIANFSAFGTGIKVAAGNGLVLRKAGALIGDDVSVGCNAVLAPGTVVGARTVIYNGSNIRGVVPADSIVKLRTTQETVSRS